jgi:molybdopterin converting factor small subunit
MISVEITFYAQLKDFFGEKLAIEIADGATAVEIRGALAVKNALAAEWLKVSRLASDDAFLNEEQQVAAGGRYYLLPPSSGG